MGLRDATVLSGAGAESLGSVPGLGGHLPSYVWRNQASLQRVEAGVDVQQAETRKQDPQRDRAADTTSPPGIAPQAWPPSTM